MKDEVNANTPPMPSPDPSGDPLARALEAMAAQAPFRAAGECAAEPPLPEAGPCPEIGAWLRLAREEASPEEQSALLTHAALCTACLSRMRECRAIISGDYSAEQIREFKHLSAATPAWRHRFARKLARTPRRSVRLQWLLCSGGAVVAALLVLAAVLGWRHANSPEHLLAAAYTEARPFDLRIPGGGFAPVKTPNHVRSEGTDTESAQLLTARARIERELKQTPTNIYWLQMEARAQLLEQRFDVAIDTLDRLLASGPVTASLLADDGMAYFLRGAATGNENDRATALDTLHRADVLAPSDPVVLFNEAVVMEDRGQVVSAVDTWNRFLRYERDSAWQAEGRRRLSALQERLNRLKSHRGRMEQHLATPEAMRAQAGYTATLASIDEALSSIFLLPLLGNLPWPAVVASDGPIGVHFALAETPSLLLEHMPGALTQHAAGRTLLAIGVSTGAGSEEQLPGALEEAPLVARTSPHAMPSACRAGHGAAGGSTPFLCRHHPFRRPCHTGGRRNPPAGNRDRKPHLDHDLLLHHQPSAARLVVFSACSMGRQEPGCNYGMGDIVETLASLGAPQVVATR